ncbi:MAG: DNA polymerase III subunit delta', partial [Bryobacterales bacterium]|nr:DNA polymerase III subunit delta' [Bryobacterales bacterium]
VRNQDAQAQLARIASATSFEWLMAATRKVDELVEFTRRNIQKGVALDSFALELRAKV